MYPLEIKSRGYKPSALDNRLAMRAPDPSYPQYRCGMGDSARCR